MNLCECGCGKITNIVQKTSKRENIRKGEPRRFIQGHQNKERMITNNPMKDIAIKKKHKESMEKREQNVELCRERALKQWRDPEIVKRHIQAQNRLEVKEKHSKAFQGNKNPRRKVPPIGEKNPNWKGGISKIPYSFSFDNNLKKFIRSKFNCTCVLCSKFAKIPHHIDYDKNNNEENNFVLLCKSCNSKVNFNRDQWEIGFKIFIGGNQQKEEK